MSKIDSIFYQSLELSPEFEFDIRIIRTQADALARGFGRYDLHYHSTWEIDYVFSGDGENIFRDTVYTFEPGDIYIIKPYEMHNAYTTSEIELFCIQFNLESVIRSVFSDSDFNGEITNSSLNFTDLIRMDDLNYQKVKEILTKILFEWQYKPSAWHSAIRLYLAEMFIVLSRYYMVNPSEKKGRVNYEHASIRDSLDYINTNYTKQICLEQVAKKAIMHKNYFCALFKKNVGCTYYTYLNNLRLKHACTLLNSTDQTIKEIALNSGFTDISTFNKAFKKALDITPSAYKNLNKRTDAQ